MKINIMNQKILGALFLLFIAFGLPACAKSKERRPKTIDIGKELLQADSTIISVLGEEIYDILSSPNQVNVYSIQPKKELSEDDYEVEPHFIRKSHIGNVSKRFQDVISYILITDTTNYGQDTTIAQTFYLPVVEIEYKKKKETVSVLISPNDNSWSIVKNSKRLLNNNYSNKEPINRLVKGLTNINSKKKK